MASEESEDEIDIKGMSLNESDDLLSDDLMTNSGSEDENKRKILFLEKISFSLSPNYV